MTVAPTADPARSASAPREALRRFHLGAAAGEAAAVPAGAMPAAHAALRALAPPADRRLEGVGELLAGVARAARERAAAARAEFAATALGLVDAADALLEADRERRPQPAGAVAERLGGLGARLFDPARVAELGALRHAGEPLPADRRRRLEAARGRLAGFAAVEPSPLLVVPPGMAPEDLDAPVRSAAEPAVVALAAFDELAAALVPVVAAARLVRLEEAGAFDPSRHAAALERLDARALDERERALVPPVVAVVRFADLLGPALGAASRLLRSGRPIQLLVLAGESDDVDGAAARLEPALLALGHREAFVQQGSAARPEELAAGLASAFASGRPGLHVVDLPEGGADAAAARLAGRVAPLVRYEPGAGAGWARRFALDGNPEPLADWPRLALDPRAVAAGAPAEAPFTAADAALLDPARRGELALVEDEPDGLVPLSDWLELPAGEELGRLPFLWAVDRDGAPLRLVVASSLARFARERRDLWRTWGELAGLRGEPIEGAAAAARRAAEERAAADLAALEAAHRAELERVRAEAAGAIVERLVGGLLRVEAGGPGA